MGYTRSLVEATGHLHRGWRCSAPPHSYTGTTEIVMGVLKIALWVMRLPFLALTPVCVLLGVGTAVWSQGSVSVAHAILTLLGALSAHICVNSLNEYLDFRSGLDFRTVRTPFSGGSGALPSEPQLAHVALAVAVVTFVVTTLVGLFYVTVRGPALLPVGILGLVVIVTYTRFLARKPWLCLVAPGLGFGPLMVLGTDFVLTGEYTRTSVVASLVPFFLVNNLLLLNQFVDVEADTGVGRNTLPSAIGKHASCHVFCAFIALAFLVLPVGVALTWLPDTSLIALLGLLIAIPTLIGVYRHSEEIGELIPFMYMNLATTLCTPLLLGVALLLNQT